MKILIVNKFLYPNGGSETYIFEIGKCLEKMGHEVQYFGMEHEGRIVGNSAEIYTDNMDFHSGKLAKIAYPFKIIYSKEAAKKIAKVMDDFRPDVVHLNNINFQLTPSIIEAIADFDVINHTDTRIIATAHDYQWVCPNHMMKRPSDGKPCFACKDGHYINCTRNKCIHGSFLRSIIGSLEAYLYKARGTYGIVDTVICPSEFIKTKLETNPELTGKCVAMHNFLVGDEAPVVDGHGKVSSDEKYVLYFGRFSEEKGIKTLIEACKALPQVKFVFAGNGPLKDEVDKVENITDVGFLDAKEMHEKIRAARFVVFPSEWYENCPFSVMESEQFGTPIIASNMGGTPELIIQGDDSEGRIPTGELFEAGNVEELTMRIKRLWENDELLNTYIEGCKQVKFDTVDEYCEKLVKLYE